MKAEACEFFWSDIVSDVAGGDRFSYQVPDQLAELKLGVRDPVVSVQESGQLGVVMAPGFLSEAQLSFSSAIASTQIGPMEVVTDRAQAYPRVLDELLPGAFHDVEQYANTKVEADPRPAQGSVATDGLKTADSTHRFCLGHAFVQNVRRGHYERGVEVPAKRRLAAACAELALVM